MYLVIDVGNTNITVGIFSTEKGNYLLKHMFRITTPHDGMTTDELAITFNNMLELQGLNRKDITRSIFASVVPNINHNITKMMSIYFNQEIINLSRSHLPKMAIHYDRPEDVGIDRLLNTKAAAALYGLPAIVIDFGTAITFDVIGKNYEFMGGLILPGLAISLNALVEKTSKLPKVELELPKKLLGNSTKESIQNGVYYINALGAEAIAKKIITNYFPNENPYTIITGGLSNFIAAGSPVFTHVEPNLCLVGLKIVLDELTN